MSLDFSTTLRTADRRLSRRRITAAIEEYQKLVDWDPTDLTTLNTLGDLYVRAGLNGEARRIFSRVAQAYRCQGFTARAIALFKKLLRMDPADLDSAASLAECYLEQGLRGDAGRQYADVAEAHQRAGRDDKALEALQRMAELDPSNASLWMMLGERSLRRGLNRRAHTNFTAAAGEYCRQGDDERALAAYLKAQTAQPGEHKTLAAITSICAARGQADHAIPILCESLERNSGDAELHKLLGSAYLSAGRLDDAERTFQRLFALDGGEYRNLLIVGEKFLENGDLDRAVEQIDGIVDALIADRTEQEAVDLLRKALACDRDHPASLRMLALIFRRVREDFNLGPTLEMLAGAALRRGDRDEAIDALKELCSLDPHNRAHRDALASLGVKAPATPLAVAAYDAREYATSDHSRQNSARRTADFQLWGYADDSVIAHSTRFTRPGEPVNRLALSDIDSSDGWLELETDECFQAAGMSQAGRAPAVAAQAVAPIPDIRGMNVFSHDISSSPADPNEPAAAFELITATNLRRTARASARVPIVVISDAGGWREFTETVDISEAGLKLQLAHRVPPMTALRVSLDMAKWPDPVGRSLSANASRGIVRYCRKEPGQRSLVGVELVAELEPATIADSVADDSSDPS